CRSWPDMPRWTTRTLASSSRQSRYLPRRSTPVNVRQTRRSANCLRVRWRRTTSTSGISGILLPEPGATGRALAVAADRFGRETVPRVARGGLLGLLLRTALAAPAHLATQRHRRVELLGVVGTLRPHVVARQLLEVARRELLQAGLVVVPAGPGGAAADALLEQAHHEVAGGAPSAVEVHGGDDRLHGVGENRLLRSPSRGVLTLPQEQRGAEPDRRGELAEDLGVDHGRAQLRELPLRQVGVLVEREVGDHHAEHGVAEELEPFVRVGVGVLGAVGTVHERTLELGGITERPPDRGLEPGERVRVHGLPRGSPEADDDVVDGFTDRVQVREVVVVDRETDGAFAQLLLERLDELDQGERVGAEVLGEPGIAREAVLVDLEDLDETLADQAQDFVGSDRRPFDVCLSRHPRPPPSCARAPGSPRSRQRRRPRSRSRAATTSRAR